MPVKITKLSNGNVKIHLATNKILYLAPHCDVLLDDRQPDNVLISTSTHGDLSINWQSVENPLNNRSYTSRQGLQEILSEDFFFISSDPVADVTAIKVNTDKIPQIIIETDKIPSIKTTVEALSNADMNVPVSDIVDNTTINEVIGNKADSAVTTVSITKSIIAYVKGILTNLNLVKIETDKIPAEVIKTSTIQTIVSEIEGHFHNWENCCGLAVTPNAELVRSELMSLYTNTHIILPFTIDAGNDNWGSWLQILGSSDTPINISSIKFDLRNFGFSANERSGVYILQVAFGTSAAQAITDKTYSMFPIAFDTANGRKESSIFVQDVAVGTKVWVRCLCPNQNTGTISFYFTIHEYPAL